MCVGAGEAGGRIAASFQEFGYAAWAINTAKPDLDGLNIPNEHKFLLNISAGGTGKDPLVVKNALANPLERDRIRQFLALTIAKEADKSLLYFLICIGGGGGSGSGLAEVVIDLVLELNLPVGLVFTLPATEEDIITKTNTVNTFQQIYNTKAINGAVSPVIIIDNAYMNKMKIPIKDFYYIVNRRVVENIHMFNSFSAQPSKYFSAVDTLDFGRLLSLGGICGLGKMNIVDPLDLNKVKEKLHESLFVQGVNIMSAKGAAVIINAAEFMLSNEHISNCIRFIFEEVSNIVSGGLVFRGVYENLSAREFEVYVMFNGMTYPQDRFNTIWEDIRKGHSTVKKKERRIDEMSFDIDESLMQTQSFQKIKRQPIKTISCNNCRINPMTKVSMNIWNGEGPMEFHSGYCPKCGGAGIYEYKE